MKTQIIIIAAALALLSAPGFAQLTSSPLEQGLYDFMKMKSPTSYQLELVNDNEMIVSGATRVDYLSPEQITISGIVAKVGTRALGRARRMIDEYNFSAAVGTMALDEVNGIVTMQHFINPKLARLPEVSHVVTMFSDALRQQSSRFNGSFGESVTPSDDTHDQCSSIACSVGH